MKTQETDFLCFKLDKIQHSSFKYVKIYFHRNNYLMNAVYLVNLQVCIYARFRLLD